MNLSKGTKAIVITIVSFAIFLLLKEYFSTIKTNLDKWTHIGLLSYILTYFIIGIPIYIGTYLINSRSRILDNLGVLHNPLKPFLIALLFSLPMLLGGLFCFELRAEISIQNMIAATIVAGVVEELFYRGFLFGMLYKYTRLGFISSVLIGAILFASGHLHQSQDPMVLVGVFGVTFMGAILFAWLYVEWDFNLWVPIFLHTLMNFSWYIFSMDETALGGVLPNVFRVLTIALAIVFTIFYKIRKNRPMAITFDKLIVKRTDIKRP